VFQRIANSFALARSSWQVLIHNKKLVAFPILSGIACLIVLASFFIPIAVLVANGTIPVDKNNPQAPWWMWVVLFAFYFCNYFVIVFCNAALVSCALMRFNGQEPTLGDGFRAAAARLPQILAWALVSATVGLILKAIENAHEKVGEIVSAILGTAWTVVTYFVVPVLVVEKIGPFAAIGRSIQILRKAWGEALVGGIGLGLFKFLLVLLGLLCLVPGIVILAISGGAVPMLITGGVVLGVGVLILLLLCAAGAALDTIFLAALYQYAAFDKIPEGFSAENMRGAFQPKQAA
jgi:hypothetical protein